MALPRPRARIKLELRQRSQGDATLPIIKTFERLGRRGGEEHRRCGVLVTIGLLAQLTPTPFPFPRSFSASLLPHLEMEMEVEGRTARIRRDLLKISPWTNWFIFNEPRQAVTTRRAPEGKNASNLDPRVSRLDAQHARNCGPPSS